MNTPNPEILKPAPGRRHARYSDEFKRTVVQACAAPGVSKSAIAMANVLNVAAWQHGFGKTFTSSQ